MPQTARKQAMADGLAVPETDALMPSASRVVELLKEHRRQAESDARGKGLKRPGIVGGMARAIGVNIGNLSSVLKGTRPAGQSFCRKAWHWMQLNAMREDDDAAEAAQAQGGTIVASPRTPIVETSVTRRVGRLCQLCLLERTMGMLIGEAGSGKTLALRAYAAQNPAAIYVKANNTSTATKRGMLDAIWRDSGLRGKHTLSEQWRRLVRWLAGGEQTSIRIVLVDDAHLLPYSVLEAIRCLYDEADVGIVLAGTTRLQSSVTVSGDAHQMYEQLRSRIGIVRVLGLPIQADVAAVAASVRKGLRFTPEASRWLAELSLSLGGFRLVRRCVGIALRLGGADKIDGTIDVRHLTKASKQQGLGLVVARRKAT
ncbi:MAG TPA: ATP-binding protein [Phycisphaerae bacterium]|nr:ATP-binding protein [Phycisphaerae bacterium]